MTFSIGFPDPAGSLCGSGEAQGLIELGNHQESFCASLGYWGIDRYQQQWAFAIKRLLDNEIASAALVTSMYDPGLANFIMWWPMYREQQKVYVYNQILFLDQLTSPLNEADLLAHVEDRAVWLEGEDTPSEWVLGVGDLVGP